MNTRRSVGIRQNTISRKPRSVLVEKPSEEPRKGVWAKPNKANEHGVVDVQEASKTSQSRLAASKLVSPKVVSADPSLVELATLREQVMQAQGRNAISAAADLFFAKETVLHQEEQELLIQLLEHTDETRVCVVLNALRTCVEDTRAVKRKPLLEHRLKRIETQAEEESTRLALAQLQKVISLIRSP